MGLDYIEVFSKLAKKKSWEARQEVVLLLTVIDLIEGGRNENNEIRLDKDLESAFEKHCMKFLHSFGFEVYLPFWYLAREEFWHIVPIYGKEDILDLVKDFDQKPSKSKLEDSIDYVELDEDLFFLMTLSSGRTGLKRALISSCFNYSEEEIFALTKDKSVEEDTVDVTKLYESLKGSQKTDSAKVNTIKTDSEEYLHLPSNIKIELNLCFFTFLKKHPYEQESILHILPDIETLYESLSSNSIKREDSTDLFITCYESLLAELKISLMHEDNAFDIIDKINDALKSLQSEDVESDSGNIKKDDDNQEDVDDTKETVAKVKSTQPAEPEIKDETENHVDVDFFIEQIKGRSYIYNRQNEKIYSSNGRLKLLGAEPYRIYLTYSHLTINLLVRDSDGVFSTGEKVIDAKYNTPLYEAFGDYERIDLIQKIETLPTNDHNAILFDGLWYDEDGMQDTSDHDAAVIETPLVGNTESNYDKESSVSANDDFCAKETANMDDDDPLNTYKPKGKIKKIKEYAKSPYDYLWMMAIIDMMGEERPQSSISIDTLALLMIANAWETNNIYPGTIEKVPDIKKCVEFYISESHEYMDNVLDWNSPKELVFTQIKDYPIGDKIEDVIDNIVKESPFRIDNVWIQTNNMMELVELSKEFYGRCLYGIHLRKHDSFIQMNPGWIWNLHNEHDLMIRYFRKLYKEMVLDSDATAQ